MIRILRDLEVVLYYALKIAYQPQKPSTVQNTRFGREGKFDLVDREQAMKPGPGDYDQ